jgi:hypothetical protein
LPVNTANVAANVFLGNGSQLTGIVSSYGNANVAAYLPTYTGLLGGTLTTAAQPNITSVGTLGSLAVTNNINANGMGITGNATIGNLVVTGTTTITGNVQQISGNSASFYGDAAGFGALYAGVATGFANLPATVLQVSSNYGDYAQINFQNINSGSSASADYILTADNGTNSTYYADFGIASSTFNGLSANALGNVIQANDAYLYTLGNTSGNIGGNLIVAAGTAGKSIRLAAGGGTTNDIVATITSGQVAVTGDVTATGNISGSFILGNGALLTGLAGTPTSLINGTSNVSVAANGNITMNVTGSRAFTLSPTQVAIGFNAASNAQSTQAVAVGQSAGQNTQGIQAVAVGLLAGNNLQSLAAVAVGSQAGTSSQGSYGVAVGFQAGRLNQSTNTVAIGREAGSNAQSTNAIAIGFLAGNTSQQSGAVAMGWQAGLLTQGAQAVAVGQGSGATTQGAAAVSIGWQAGLTSQGAGAIAIGQLAGNNAQGANSIAIGRFAGQTTQVANSIILNASGTALNGTNAGFYVNPVRSDTGNTGNVVYYNATTRELTYTNIPAVNVFGNTSVNLAVAFASYQVPLTVEFSPEGWFASNQYTPQRAGWYQVSWSTNCWQSGFSTTAQNGGALRKNGTGVSGISGIGLFVAAGSKLVYMNGTTDYLDIAAFSGSTGTVTLSADQTFMTATWVRP